VGLGNDEMWQSPVFACMVEKKDYNATSMTSEASGRPSRPTADCSSEELIEYLNAVGERLAIVGHQLLNSSDPSPLNLWMGRRGKYRLQFTHLLSDLSELLPGYADKAVCDRPEPPTYPPCVEIEISNKIELIETLVNELLQSELYRFLRGLDRKCDINSYRSRLLAIQQAGRRRLHKTITTLSGNG
jgi:hypothetical protein